jgi:Tfp pilus assembly protein FimT
MDLQSGNGDGLHRVASASAMNTARVGDGPGAALRSPRRSTRRSLGDQGGWTLMELMVACSMFAILAGIAVPQYRSVALQMRTTAAANFILSDLTYAREMAQRTGIPHYVDVTAGALNYSVKRTAAPPAVVPASDPAIRNQALSQRLSGVAFSLNGATADPYGAAATAATPPGRIIFNARGLPNAPGAYFVASTDGKYSHVVAVTGAGRIRLWTRVGSTWR